VAFLFHIAFSNAHRLARRTYYFEYATTRFKLVQNASLQWADVLLSIVPESESPGEASAYSAAGEFLSALSWANHSSVSYGPSGGAGFPEGWSLRQARCRVFTFPTIPFRGRQIGYGIHQLPAIETTEQRLALALLREARASNSPWLSLLLLWQIIEVGGNGNAAGWITTMHRRRRVRVAPDSLQLLGLGSRRLGDYFQDDCRHAIAHIRRSPGKRRLVVDDLREFTRLAVSTRVLEDFAVHHVREGLGLRKGVWLVQVGGRGFPVFKNEAFVRGTRCTLVDDARDWARVLRSRW
jgi:hypothetical protein